MDHPNVVGFREILDEDDYVAFAMDYIDGVTLSDWLRQRPGGVDEPTLAALFVDVLRGVAHAHEQDVIHRDIKPSNILIERSGGRLRARLIDFGVARRSDRPLRRDELDKIEGTAAYISPEEIRDPETVERSSDLYSLGVVMYEAACGERPFEAERAERLFAAHTSRPPRPLREHRPELSSAFESIVLKALAKRPVSRFGSADEMIEGLEQAVRGLVGGDSEPFAVEEVVETREWTREESFEPDDDEWTADEAERVPVLLWLEMALTFLMSTGHTGGEGDPHHLNRDHSPELELPQV
jgi:serine/threonine-protein kinase